MAAANPKPLLSGAGVAQHTLPLLEQGVPLLEVDDAQAVAHALAPAAAHCALPPARRLLSVADAKKVEPRHRLISSDLGGTKKTRSRKQWKELKKKKRVTWGTGRREAARMAKKAAAA